MDLNNVIEYIEKEDLLKGTEGNSLCDKAFLDKAEQEIGAKCQMIILELTGSCNLRCKYCIYHAKEKSFREFNQESMPKETIRKSVDFIRDHHGEDTVFISFYTVLSDRYVRNKRTSVFSPGFGVSPTSRARTP